jgi:hypothetical protein
VTQWCNNCHGDTLETIAHATWRTGLRIFLANSADGIERRGFD